MMTPKENYLTMLRGEIPEYVPSVYEARRGVFGEDFLTPQTVPAEGFVMTKLGIKYVGSAELDYGAMPDPYRPVLEDVTKWRDWVKLPDISGVDWETYYKNKIKDIDRTQKYISVTCGDYFLTLVSIMGFGNALIALCEEPEEVKALLTYISDYFIEIMKKQIQYVKPEAVTVMDDDSAWHSPFFSLDTYREIFKPFHKRHCDLANENGILIERHDCGKCEQFIPDWLEMGIRSWNPAQTCNDLKGIKAKYGNRLAICGGWHAPDWSSSNSDEELLAALKEYTDTFAPGGGFTFMARVNGPKDDQLTKEKNALVRKFYDEYVHDYYK